MTLEQFQSDLRRNFASGGIGAIVSGVVWVLAAAVAVLKVIFKIVLTLRNLSDGSAVETDVTERGV